MRPILKIFYKTIQAFNYSKKFTKSNFIENFIKDDKFNKKRWSTVNYVINESEEFI